MILTGKKGLIVGIANEQSIAWGCAKVFHQQGAQLAVTYLNDKAKPYVETLAQKVQSPIFSKLDVTKSDEQEMLFESIQKKWGKLDFLLHSIAFAPKNDLWGRVIDSSKEGFSQAMDISCHSLMRLSKSAEPLMTDSGGSILTLSYYGAKKVLPNYNLMGPVKAALESSVQYMSHELGCHQIRVNALSVGPVRTRAASGIAEFESLVEQAEKNSPLKQLVNLDQIGEMASLLVSDKAKQITGQTIYIDAGYSTKG